MREGRRGGGRREGRGPTVQACMEEERQGRGHVVPPDSLSAGGDEVRSWEKIGGEERRRRNRRGGEERKRGGGEGRRRGGGEGGGRGGGEGGGKGGR